MVITISYPSKLENICFCHLILKINGETNYDGPKQSSFSTILTVRVEMLKFVFMEFDNNSKPFSFAKSYVHSALSEVMRENQRSTSWWIGIQPMISRRQRKFLFNVINIKNTSPAAVSATIAAADTMSNPNIHCTSGSVSKGANILFSLNFSKSGNSKRVSCFVSARFI